MAPERAEKLQIGNVSISLPAFFPSVSSVKTAMLPRHYVELLAHLSFTNKQFLVSAFDIQNAIPSDKDAIIAALGKAQGNNALVLMDSGNYESFWKNAQHSWRQEDFHAVLKGNTCSLAFGFDDQEPPESVEAHISLIEKRWRQDQEVAGEQLIVPIVHRSSKELPSVVSKVAEITGVSIIAVPERKLGEGIFERAQTVSAIRAALNDLGRYVVLHLLGTGNPISISIYALAGADSFDGLEWCQTVVDHETGLLYHLTQSDFFKTQTSWGDGDYSFQARTLAHNLEFYIDWMTRLQKAIYGGKGIAFCRMNFPDRIYRHCATALEWEATS